jgi:hypothetical protein
MTSNARRTSRSTRVLIAASFAPRSRLSAMRPAASTARTQTAPLSAIRSTRRKYESTTAL